MRIVLFDADGVLALPEEVFSVVYARSHGLDIKPFKDFFKHEWGPIVTGKKDLKEHILNYPNLWQWDGTPEELLEFWFKTEDVANNQLLEIINKLRSSGTPCYLATDQEKYRAEYMRTKMFNSLFDGYYVSAELGVTKTDPKFFKHVLSDLQYRHRGLDAGEIIFFDDSQTKVDTAKAVGIDGRLFVGNEQVQALLK